MAKTKQTPGTALNALLKKHGLNYNRLAKAIGLSSAMVRLIARDENPVSASVAYRLAKFFKTKPEYWLVLQMDFDNAKAAKDKKLAKALSGISTVDKVTFERKPRTTKAKSAKKGKKTAAKPKAAAKKTGAKKAVKKAAPKKTAKGAAAKSVKKPVKKAQSVKKVPKKAAVKTAKAPAKKAPVAKVQPAPKPVVTVKPEPKPVVHQPAPPVQQQPLVPSETKINEPQI
jgi:addiction module HigA family antidote